MKIVKRMLVALLILVLSINVLVSIKDAVFVSAEDELAKPNFKLKLINDGTGVKIVINKTKGAVGYYIYMFETDTPYTEYRDDTRLSIRLKKLEKNGKKKRSFSINGLPEGTYTFRISAYKLDERGFEDYAAVYSDVKSITVKAGKDVVRENVEYDFTDVKVGDIISFGVYEQDDDMNNGKEAIKWIVLSKSDSKMLLLSQYVLDVISYNKTHEDVTWETCTLRKWLNEEFYNIAFNDKEKAMIKKTKLKNLRNPYLEYSKDSASTKDRVFLLSIQDVLNPKYGFQEDFLAHDKLRRSSPTKYAIAKGAYPHVFEEGSEYLIDNTSCGWWLRTMGDLAENAVDVFFEGQAIYKGHTDYYGDEWHKFWSCDVYVSSPGMGVRPALYIDLKK